MPALLLYQIHNLRKVQRDKQWVYYPLKENNNNNNKVYGYRLLARPYLHLYKTTSIIISLNTKTLLQLGPGGVISVTLYLSIQTALTPMRVLASCL